MWWNIFVHNCFTNSQMRRYSIHTITCISQSCDIHFQTEQRDDHYLVWLVLHPPPHVSVSWYAKKCMHQLLIWLAGILDINDCPDSSLIDTTKINNKISTCIHSRIWMVTKYCCAVYSVLTYFPRQEIWLIFRFLIIFQVSSTWHTIIVWIMWEFSRLTLNWVR